MLVSLTSKDVENLEAINPAQAAGRLTHPKAIDIYLYTFSTYLEMLLITCEIELVLAWTENYFLSSDTIATIQI